MSKKSKLNDKSTFSETSGFYNLLPKDRLSLIKKLTSLTDDQYNLLRKKSNLDLNIADNMVENVIGTFPIPELSIRFRIDCGSGHSWFCQSAHYFHFSA